MHKHVHIHANTIGMHLNSHPRRQDPPLNTDMCRRLFHNNVSLEYVKPLQLDLLFDDKSSQIQVSQS